MMFNLAPRNEREAVVVNRIINKLKFHQHPEYRQGTANTSYFLHPSTFDISFIDLSKGATNPWVGKMTTCALTMLSVNGTPNGEYSVLKNGHFTTCTLELTFTELSLLTKTDFVDPMDSA
jgi:hypothetical protein